MDKRHTEESKYVVNKFNEYKEFIKDKQISFVIKKTERIVYGVYMLSEFIPHIDSLYSELRTTAHKLLHHVSLFVSPTSLTSSDTSIVHAQLQYMSSLLSLSYVSGYISSSNIEIMKNEINYLHKHIEELSSRTHTETGQLHIKSDLFVVSNPKLVHQRPVDNLIENISVKHKTVEQNPPKPKPKMSFITSSVGAKAFRLKGDDREQRVLDVIRNKGIVSIKDISTVIFDVSEKTIQRTLNTLIDKGQIKKNGERRWAKYQVV